MFKLSKAKSKRQATRRGEKAATSINWSRLSRIIIGLLIVSSIIWGWQTMRSPGSFPITRVRIIGGEKHLTRSEIQQAVLPAIQHSGFFTLPVDELQQSLAMLPWVEKDEIKRVWPNEVVIMITEQQAAARWNENSVLNNKGEIFTPDVDTIPKGLVELNGPQAQAKQMLQRMQQMNKIIAKLGLHITQLQLSLRHSWQITLNNGMNIMLGQTDVLPRLTRFARVYQKIFIKSSRAAAYADLRYSNGMAVKWKRGT